MDAGANVSFVIAELQTAMFHNNMVLEVHRHTSGKTPDGLAISCNYDQITILFDKSVNDYHEWLKSYNILSTSRFPEPAKAEYNHWEYVLQNTLSQVGTIYHTYLWITILIIEKIHILTRLHICSYGPYTRLLSALFLL